jgi:hypothetical protein
MDAARPRPYRQDGMSAPSEPLLNPLQQSDVRRMVSMVPNERRLPVIAAYLGLPPWQFYRLVGLHARMLSYYKIARPQDEKAGMAMAWCWKVASRLGLLVTDLYDIDDEFDPHRALGALPRKIAAPRLIRLAPRQTGTDA